MGSGLRIDKAELRVQSVCVFWKFIKRRALYGRYHPSFAQFQASIQEVLDDLSTTHAAKLKSLMTLNFQRFEDVSLMAA